MTYKQYMAEEKSERERRHAESEARKKAHADHIAALRAEVARLDKIIEARCGKPVPIGTPLRLERERMARDTLTYLPAWQGHDYAQGEEEGELLKVDLEEVYRNISKRMEIASKLGIEEFFLDQDHDFKSRLFLVDRLFYIPCQGIFADGRWSAEGLRLKPLFAGVSPAWMSISPEHPKHPVSLRVVAAKQKQLEEINETLEGPIDTFGTLGSVCIHVPPVFKYYNQADLEAIKASSNTSNKQPITTVTTWEDSNEICIDAIRKV